MRTRQFLSSNRHRYLTRTHSGLAHETNNSVPEKFKSVFLTTLFQRGYIHQCTNFEGLDHLFSTKDNIVSSYLGFDATASSLHVGSLVQIMMLRILQKSGHKPIVLVGGGTTTIGDPSGKDESRIMLSDATISSNVESISKIFAKFLQFGDGDTDAIIVNNADWLMPINYLDFLRSYGRHFSINRMLTMESVKQRLSREQPLSFLEFNYMILQAYDFLELSRRYSNCQLQLGGSDQWGNIVSGIELARRVDNSKHLFGLTAPLITTSDGRKMGKSADGAVWLDKALLSEFDYWQFWRSTADVDVVRFLKLFTEVPLSAIRPLEQLSGAALNAAKVLLADEATALLHGRDCLSRVHATATALFGRAAVGEEHGGPALGLHLLPRFYLDHAMMQRLYSTAVDAQSQQSSQSQSQAGGVAVVDLLILSGLTATRKEGKRLVQAGGVRVNDVKVSSDAVVAAACVQLTDFGPDGALKLSSGKKHHVVISLAEN